MSQTRWAPVDRAPLLVAAQAVDAARVQLVAAVQAAFPLGARVAVTLGGNRVRGEVISHGDSWSAHTAGYVEIENEITGKRRSFYGPSEFVKAEVAAEAAVVTW